MLDNRQGRSAAPKCRPRICDSSFFPSPPGKPLNWKFSGRPSVARRTSITHPRQRHSPLDQVPVTHTWMGQLQPRFVVAPHHRAASPFLFRFIQERAREASEGRSLGPLPSPFAHADEYLCASILQKAVRRADLATARRAGHQLYRLDRDRLWRRLAVIGLEDVGIASVEVAAELIGIGTTSAARKLFGGDLRALDHALARSCTSIKDRSGDHACSIVSREPLVPGDQVLQAASPNALLAVVASSSAPWPRRLRAAVMATGRGADCYPVRGATEALLGVFREMGAPELLIAACSAYAAIQRDALPVFIPLVWCLQAVDPAPSQATVHYTAPTEQIGELPGYAFDPVNTRLGRRAVDLFMRAHLMKLRYSAKAIAAAIWNMESAVCDRTTAWPLGEELRQRAYRADLTIRGVPTEEHDVLNAWVAAEWPALRAARQAVWDSHVRQSGKPAEALEQSIQLLPVPGGWPRHG